MLANLFRSAFVASCALALAGCQSGSTGTAASPTPGQLFCAIEQPAGPIVVGLIEAGASPLAILATNATASFVTAACALAGGIPVSPPANPATAPQVAVIPPAAS